MDYVRVLQISEQICLLQSGPLFLLSERQQWNSFRHVKLVCLAVLHHVYLT